MSASSRSNDPGKTHLRWQTLLILFCAALISTGGFLAASAFHLHTGFPLDDAWIHQTYARNLAVRGEWAFIPGQPSGGSTSPLWTILLAAGNFLRLAPFTWTFVLGGLLLVGLAVLVEKGMALLVAGPPARLPWAGLLVIFEWHFVWSAVSGMETLLQAVLILLVILLLLRKFPPWLGLGLLTGLSTWVRPDGITLLAPILLTALLLEKDLKKKGAVLLLSLAGFGALFAPYLLFNFSLTGTIFPTTFYAKQAEYALWQSSPILGRIGGSTLKFLAGAAMLLLPGIALQVKEALARRHWGQIAAMLWLLGYLGIYMLRLPLYQHGRYLIPAMPIYFLLGLGGVYRYIFSRGVTRRFHSLLKFAWGATLLMVAAGFWFLGMRSYTTDVEFIETEMVATARWVAANLPEDALVAAHDIGALGYFDHHHLVDLAGLVSPEVIPFLRDERRLALYLDEQGVSYLVTFPDWYDSLAADLIPVFTTGAAYAPSVGGTNMAVYAWPGP
jgi:hypothetical protein